MLLTANKTHTIMNYAQSILSSFRRLSINSLNSIENLKCHQSNIQAVHLRTISSNRSKRGLYDGKDIRSGNNVSFSMRKTKRKFKPNVFNKKIYSEVLDEKVQFKVTASALRSIDKMGGLDNYLLKSKHVKEGKGLEVKLRVLEKLEKSIASGDPVLGEIVLQKNMKEGVNQVEVLP